MGVKSESKWRRAVVLRIRGARVKAAAGKVRKDQASGKVVRSKAMHLQRQLSIRTMHTHTGPYNAFKLCVRKQKTCHNEKSDFAVFSIEKRLAKNPRL
jgi:hypothetical protein